MPNNSLPNVPTFQITVSVTVPPMIIDVPSLPPSPILPTLSISGPDSKLAKIIYEKLVKSSDRRAFALVLASPAITDAQKKNLTQSFRNAYKQQLSGNMFDSFLRKLHKLDKIRKQSEAGAVVPEQPGDTPPPEPPPTPETPDEPDEDEEPNYTGKEKALELKMEAPVEPETVFDVRPPKVPVQAVPIYDGEANAIIGYRAEVARGVYENYDLGGKVVGMSEKPLERPLIDLPDIFFFLESLGLRLLSKGALKLGLFNALKTAAKVDIKVIGLNSITRMRAFAGKAAVNDLKFTASTVARMNMPGRHVPAHLLDMAIKYGKAGADPDGIKGVLEYTIPFRRAVKQPITEATLNNASFKEYTLKVVVRVKDRTVLHFHYE